jgi:hypothetical protein
MRRESTTVFRVALGVHRRGIAYDRDDLGDLAQLQDGIPGGLAG